jgi:hypothetical protein
LADINFKIEKYVVLEQSIGNSITPLDQYWFRWSRFAPAKPMKLIDKIKLERVVVKQSRSSPHFSRNIGASGVGI